MRPPTKGHRINNQAPSRRFGDGISPCEPPNRADFPHVNILSRIAIPLLASLISCAAEPPDPSRTEVKNDRPPAETGYLSESPLPEGWPEPGPYDRVTRKKYPAYRAASTSGGGANRPFGRLFSHIQRNGIPMTAPVEMKIDADESRSGQILEMAFLYQHPGVGKTGADGDRVEVRDMPAVETLSYAWQGPRNNATIAKARTAIDAELTKQNLQPAGYRLLGYNSPFVPRGRQTHELQALLP